MPNQVLACESPLAVLMDRQKLKEAIRDQWVEASESYKARIQQTRDQTNNQQLRYSFINWEQQISMKQAIALYQVEMKLRLELNQKLQPIKDWYRMYLAGVDQAYDNLMLETYIPSGIIIEQSQ